MKHGLLIINLKEHLVKNHNLIQINFNNQKKIKQLMIKNNNNDYINMFIK